MAQWLYRIVPTRPEMVADPTADEQRIVSAHFRYLVDLKERGVLILAGRTQEHADTFGITIFEADDEAAARAVMDGDPAVAAGVFAASLHPYAVAVARDGLAGS
ncbi:MAG TPA: YciI family protein [Microbacterium sp.]|uniref:YciI family protein n=1 Tax=Microbacterium sp. TaxID=51671 RepID=UPI002D142DB3|nr:YciI family protein [Microbacterium sp.]HWI32388.1 YciI family protein [Microbacterium sp.]